MNPIYTVFWTLPFIYSIIGIQNDMHLGASLNFFIYETLKILLLLIIIIFLMGIVNSYFPTERLRNYLAKTNLGGWSIYLPLCSVQ